MRARHSSLLFPWPSSMEGNRFRWKKQASLSYIGIHCIVQDTILGDGYQTISSKKIGGIFDSI